MVEFAFHSTVREIAAKNITENFIFYLSFLNRYLLCAR